MGRIGPMSSATKLTGLNMPSPLSRIGAKASSTHYYDKLPPQCIWIYLYERFAAEIAMLFRISKVYGTHWQMLLQVTLRMISFNSIRVSIR